MVVVAFVAVVDGGGGGGSIGWVGINVEAFSGLGGIKLSAEVGAKPSILTIF